MVYEQPRIHPAKWDTQRSLGFWDIKGSLNFGQTTRPSNSKKKEE